MADVLGLGCAARSSVNVLVYWYRPTVTTSRPVPLREAAFSRAKCLLQS